MNLVIFYRLKPFIKFKNIYLSYYHTITEK